MPQRLYWPCAVHREFLPLANEVWGKVMFLHLSICSQGGLHLEGGLGRPSIGYNRIRSTSGRYASYWNAFLLPFISAISTERKVSKQFSNWVDLGIWGWKWIFRQSIGSNVKFLSVKHSEPLLWLVSRIQSSSNHSWRRVLTWQRSH